MNPISSSQSIELITGRRPALRINRCRPVRFASQIPASRTSICPPPSAPALHETVYSGTTQVEGFHRVACMWYQPDSGEPLSHGSLSRMRASSSRDSGRVRYCLRTRRRMQRTAETKRSVRKIHADVLLVCRSRTSVSEGSVTTRGQVMIALFPLRCAFARRRNSPVRLIRGSTTLMRTGSIRFQSPVSCEEWNRMTKNGILKETRIQEPRRNAQVPDTTKHPNTQTPNPANRKPNRKPKPQKPQEKDSHGTASHQQPRPDPSSRHHLPSHLSALLLHRPLLRLLLLLPLLQLLQRLSLLLRSLRSRRTSQDSEPSRSSVLPSPPSPRHSVHSARH